MIHAASLNCTFLGELHDATKQLEELRLCAEDLGFDVQESAVGEHPVPWVRLLRSAA